MKSKLLKIGIALIAFVVFGCLAQAQTSQNVTYTEAASRVMEPSQSIVVNPIVADVKIVSDKKIQFDTIFPIRVTAQIQQLVPGLKKSAFLAASRKHNADVLVAPTYSVTTTAQGTVKITIWGWPGIYTNFRNASANDLWMVQMNNATQTYDMINANNNTSMNIKTTKYTQE